MKKIFLTFVLFFISVISYCNIEENKLFSKNAVISKSVTINNLNTNILVSEILIENKKVGYIGISKSSNEKLYVVEFLYESNSVKLIDIKNNRNTIINLKSKENFDNFISKDLVKEIEEKDLKGGNEQSKARPFFGESCGGCWTVPSGQSYQTCCYYIFWIESGCDVVSC